MVCPAILGPMKQILGQGRVLFTPPFHRCYIFVLGASSSFAKMKLASITKRGMRRQKYFPSSLRNVNFHVSYLFKEAIKVRITGHIFSECFTEGLNLDMHVFVI